MLNYLKQILQTLNTILTMLAQAQQKVEQMSLTLQDFKDALAEADAETTRIAARIEELVGLLTSGGLNAEEEQEAFNELKAHAEKLKTVGVVPQP